MSRQHGGSLGFAASALFFVSYLVCQIAYPMVPWFIGGDRAFTWRMFAGYDVETQFTVVNGDGVARPIANALRSGPGTGVRVLGPEVDQRRFLPPWLCTHASGARSIVVRDRVTPQDTVIPCRSIAP
jgi:hypothetical protein